MASANTALWETEDIARFLQNYGVSTTVIDKLRHLQISPSVFTEKTTDALHRIGIDEEPLISNIANDWVEFSTKGYSPSYIDRMLNFEEKLPQSIANSFALDTRPVSESMKRAATAPAASSVEELVETVHKLQRLLEQRTVERDYIELQLNNHVLEADDHSQALREECRYWKGVVKNVEEELTKEIEYSMDLKARLHEHTFASLENKPKVMLDEETQWTFEDAMGGFSMVAASTTLDPRLFDSNYEWSENSSYVMIADHNFRFLASDVGTADDELMAGEPKELMLRREDYRYDRDDSENNVNTFNETPKIIFEEKGTNTNPTPIVDTISHGQQTEAINVVTADQQTETIAIATSSQQTDVIDMVGCGTDTGDMEIAEKEDTVVVQDTREQEEIQSFMATLEEERQSLQAQCHDLQERIRSLEAQAHKDKQTAEIDIQRLQSLLQERVEEAQTQQEVAQEELTAYAKQIKELKELAKKQEGSQLQDDYMQLQLTTYEERLLAKDDMIARLEKQVTDLHETLHLHHQGETRRRSNKKAATKKNKLDSKEGVDFRKVLAEESVWEDIDDSQDHQEQSVEPQEDVIVTPTKPPAATKPLPSPRRSPTHGNKRHEDDQALQNEAQIAVLQLALQQLTTAFERQQEDMARMQSIIQQQQQPNHSAPQSPTGNGRKASTISESNSPKRPKTSNPHLAVSFPTTTSAAATTAIASEIPELSTVDESIKTLTLSSTNADPDSGPELTQAMRPKRPQSGHSRRSFPRPSTAGNKPSTSMTPAVDVPLTSSSASKPSSASAQPAYMQPTRGRAGHHAHRRLMTVVVDREVNEEATSRRSFPEHSSVDGRRDRMMGFDEENDGSSTRRRDRNRDGGRGGDLSLDSPTNHSASSSRHNSPRHVRSSLREHPPYHRHQDYEGYHTAEIDDIDTRRAARAHYERLLEHLYSHGAAYAADMDSIDIQAISQGVDWEDRHDSYADNNDIAYSNNNESMSGRDTRRGEERGEQRSPSRDRYYQQQHQFALQKHQELAINRSRKPWSQQEKESLLIRTYDPSALQEQDASGSYSNSHQGISLQDYLPGGSRQQKVKRPTSANYIFGTATSSGHNSRPLSGRSQVYQPNNNNNSSNDTGSNSGGSRPSTTNTTATRKKSSQAFATFLSNLEAKHGPQLAHMVQQQVAQDDNHLQQRLAIKSYDGQEKQPKRPNQDAVLVKKKAPRTPPIDVIMHMKQEMPAPVISTTKDAFIVSMVPSRKDGGAPGQSQAVQQQVVQQPHTYYPHHQQQQQQPYPPQMQPGQPQAYQPHAYAVSMYPNPSTTVHAQLPAQQHPTPHQVATQQVSFPPVFGYNNPHPHQQIQQQVHHPQQLSLHHQPQPPPQQQQQQSHYVPAQLPDAMGPTADQQARSASSQAQQILDDNPRYSTL